MTPEEIKPGHTYELTSGTHWTVKSFTGDGRSVIITDGEVTTFDTPHNFARYAVRDVTTAPESDQGEKVAEAQSQAASCMNGMDVLPCPFCGSDETGFDGPVIECLACAAVGPSLPEDDELKDADVVAAWNRRTPPAADAVNAELLEVLRGLLNELPSAATHPAIKAARAAIARAEAGE